MKTKKYKKTTISRRNGRKKKSIVVVKSRDSIETQILELFSRVEDCEIRSRIHLEITRALNPSDNPISSLPPI